MALSILRRYRYNVRTSRYQPGRRTDMSRVKVYSTGVCPICDKAKTLLCKWQIPFEEIRIDIDQAARREFVEVTNGARTVPQIVIDGECIGGFSELTELHMEDKLDHLVQA